MMTTADDLLSALVSSLSAATDQTLIQKLDTLAGDSAHCELAAVAALMVANTDVRVAAPRVLETHGSPRTVAVLRDLACNGDVDRDIRIAAERAHGCITARAIQDGWSSAVPGRLLRAS